MNRQRRDRLLGVGVTMTAALGLGGIVLGGAALTTVGVVLVVLSAVGFIPIVKDGLARRGRSNTD